MKTVAELHGEVCDYLKKLYAEKNADYGDSFSSARVEIPYYTLGRLYDKFNRYKTVTLRGGEHVVADETVDDTLLDLANYCLMEYACRQYGRQDGAPENEIEHTPDTENVNYVVSPPDGKATTNSKITLANGGELIITYEDEVYIMDDGKHVRKFYMGIDYHTEDGKYYMNIVIPEEWDGGYTFIAKGLERLRVELADFVATLGESSGYVVKYDDIVSGNNITAESVDELYEKFAFFVRQYKMYTANTAGSWVF